MDIDWKKYFDHIYCIHYAPYKDRLEGIKDELTRVGIEGDIFSFHYTFPFDMKHVSFEIERKMTPAQRNLAFAHYSVMQEALFCGYERILILEDDIRFLKNVSDISVQLECIPEDADEILFDRVGIESQKDDIQSQYEHAMTGSTNYVWNGNVVLWCASCYSVNRKAMEHIIECQDKCFNVADYYTNPFSPIDGKLVFDDIKRAFEVRSIAIQMPASDGSVTNHGTSKWVYKQPGLMGINVVARKNQYNL